MIEQIKSLLERNYGFKVKSIKETKGGWAALAFIVETDNNKYFLKLYDMKRASSITYTKYIDGYARILLQLHNLKDNITIPILTKDNKSYVEENGYRYLLLEFIDGDTVASGKLTATEKLLLVDIINKLHNAKIDSKWNLEKETFVVETNNKLKNFIKNPTDNEVFEIISSKMKSLVNIIDYVEKTSKKYQNNNIDMVLCHTDIHTYNMMRKDGKLWLIDWEGLKISPKENDLALLDDEYKQVVVDYYNGQDIDQELMKYYPLKRKIDDIWEWIELLVIDNNYERRKEYIENLKAEISDI